MIVNLNLFGTLSCIVYSKEHFCNTRLRVKFCRQYSKLDLDIDNKFWLFLDKRLSKVLPSESCFKQGLYMFDVGQNDLDGAFYSKTEDQIVASIPNIISEFESGLKVKLLCRYKNSQSRDF